MSDRPRLLGRVGGTTSAGAFATQVRDAEGYEPERVDKDFEEELVKGALPLSERLRERGRIEREIPEVEKRLRKAIEKAVERARRKEIPLKGDRLGSVRAMKRALRRRRKRVAELDAEIGRLQSEKRSRAA